MSDREQSLEAGEPFDLEQAPLEPPPPFEIDWGGDGSDLLRPVRAHVLAALPPVTGPYAPPLNALLTLGDVDDAELKRHADELGIGQEHAPELLRMLRDRALATALSDTPVVWAPSHALHLLASLDLSTYVDNLIPIFDLDFDRFGDELMGIVASVGAPAVAPLGAYVRDRTRWVWGRSRAADTLGQLAERYPALREEAITILSTVLADAEIDHEDAITGVMGALVELKAVETLPLIRRAFELGKIDETMEGPWGDILARIGVAPEPGDPLVEVSRLRFEERHRRMFPPELRESLAIFQGQQRAEQTRTAQRAAAQNRKQDQARKEKNRRKTAAASRKANRKKRR